MRIIITLAALLLMACPGSEPTTTPEPETESAQSVIECVKEKGIYCFCPDDDCAEYLTEREDQNHLIISIGGPEYDCIH